jgi:hypothetical protein
VFEKKIYFCTPLKNQKPMSLISTTERFNSFIEKRVGLSLSEIIRKDNDEASAFIEKSSNYKLVLDAPDIRVPYCGSTLLYSGRTISSQDSV